MLQKKKRHRLIHAPPPHPGAGGRNKPGTGRGHTKMPRQQCQDFSIQITFSPKQPEIPKNSPCPELFCPRGWHLPKAAVQAPAAATASDPWQPPAPDRLRPCKRCGFRPARAAGYSKLCPGTAPDRHGYLKQGLRSGPAPTVRTRRKYPGENSRDDHAKAAEKCSRHELWGTGIEPGAAFGTLQTGQQAGSRFEAGATELTSARPSGPGAPRNPGRTISGATDKRTWRQQ